MEIKSFVLVKEEGRYLLIKEASFRWKGHWFLPGGNVKKGERPDLAVIRETKEEAGCEIILTGLFYVKCYQGLFGSKLHLFYTGKRTGNELKVHPNKHSLDAGFFTYDELSELPLRQKLLKIIDRYRKADCAIPVKNFKLILLKSLLQRLIK
jgi:ADP-ribose pyrophosphatase YjhB (NUDIX family)